MSIRVARVLILVAAGLTGLAGCSTSSTKIGDAAATGDSASAGAADSDTTGSIVTTPAEPGPSGEPVAPSVVAGPAWRRSQ